MRVALDFRMANHTGIGRYLRSLLPPLAEHCRDLELLLLVPDDVAPPSPLPPGIEFLRWPEAPEVYAPEEQWIFTQLQERYPFDLLHIPHFHAPVLSGPPMVLTVHDLVFLHYPEECPSYSAHLYAQLMFRLTTSRARRILTDSRTVQEDVIETLGVPREKVLCARLGAPPQGPTPEPEEIARTREELEIGERYLLSVGMQRPRKNLQRLVQAYDRSRLHEQGIQLVLAGPRDERGAEVGVEIRRRGLLAHVRQTGFVAEEHLAPLYAGATGFVLPSLYEGFGFPVVEAFQFGIPVACSRGGSLPEVVGDAAITFDALDVPEMALALRALVEDDPRRQELISAGYHRIDELSWDEAARVTARAYREALGLDEPEGRSAQG